MNYILKVLSVMAFAIFLGRINLSSAQSLSSAISKKGVKVEILTRSGIAWDGSEYSKYPKGKPELAILKIVVDPNTEMPWHYHSIPSAGYVLSGELFLIKEKTKERVSFKEGEAITEMVDVVHRGFTGEKGVTLIVFYATVKDRPLSNLVD